MNTFNGNEKYKQKSYVRNNVSNTSFESSPQVRRDSNAQKYKCCRIYNNTLIQNTKHTINEIDVTEYRVGESRKIGNKLNRMRYKIIMLTNEAKTYCAMFVLCDSEHNCM